MDQYEVRGTIVTAIQKRIFELTISKAEISRQARVPPSYITRLSRGEGFGISLDRLIRIATSVGLTVKFALEEADAIASPDTDTNTQEVF